VDLIRLRASTERLTPPDRLSVAPRQTDCPPSQDKPEIMPRRRNNEIRRDQQVWPGCGHPSRQQGETATPALMFQGEDEIAEDVATDQGGGGPVAGRGTGEAGATKLGVVHRDLERGSTAGAERRGDELQPGSIVRLQGLWAGDFPSRDTRALGPDQAAQPAQQGRSAEQPRGPRLIPRAMRRYILLR